MAHYTDKPISFTQQIALLKSYGLTFIDESKALKALLAEFPRVDVHAMGFPTEWDKESLWN